MDEEINNYEEPSASSELSNMGRKTIGVAQNIGNLALGMGKGIKAGLKDKDDKDKSKLAEKADGLPKKSSIDDSSDDIKDIGKKVAKTGGKIAKEGAKVVGNGLKKLWMLIPPPWNFIVLGFLLVLILVLCLILALGGSSDSCEYETAVPYEYNCPTINVVGVGDVPFEEYVAGVVGGEVGVLKNPELYKALAVGARTYALNYTNKCTKSIPNNTTAQVYNPNYINDEIMEAVEATEDEVLIYNGSLIATMYDSFNVSRGSCSGSTCSTTYTKLPNGEKHTVTISSPYYNYVNGGHGSGLSQVAAYEMAENGSTYEEILEFFYSDGVQIANHTSENCEKEQGEADFAPRNYDTGSIYNDSETLGEIRKAAPNVYYLLNNSSLKYQCVTYARLRAVEILLTTSVYDEATRAKAISIINNHSHNGWGWYYGGIPALGNFNGDDTCTEFKPGSIIAFKGNGSRACCGTGYKGTCYCGHVAIVEDVDYDNETIRITDGYTSLRGAYHEVTYTFDSIKYGYGGCIATTYLLEYHG